MAKKPFTILNAYVYALVSYSFGFDPLCGHYFSVWLPSKVTRSFTHCVRLPASCNNALRHIAIFLDAVIAA